MYILLPFLGIPILIGQLAEKDSNAFVKTGVGFILISVSLLVISLIIGPIVLFNWWVLEIKPNILYGTIMEVGLITWFGVLLIGFYTGGEQLYKYIFNRETHTPKESNVVVAFVKAKYHKYCLPINWN
jgi:hypothetical protein